MKNKEIKGEIMIDYVAKGRAESSILNTCFACGIAIAYMAYTFCSIITAFGENPFSEKQTSGGTFCGLFLMLFFMVAVPVAFVYAFLPYEGIEKEIEAARKFLLEAGQEASKENINLLLNRYHKGNWEKIEDMLYENRKVFSAESMELVLGNESEKRKKLMI